MVVGQFVLPTGTDFARYFGSSFERLLMAWIWLLGAGIVEIVMAISLKYSEGWTRLGPSILGLAASMISIGMLTMAIKTLPIGTAYAIWTGIGAIGVTLIGILVFREDTSLLRLGCMALIFIGIIGLKFLPAQ